MPRSMQLIIAVSVLSVALPSTAQPDVTALLERAKVAMQEKNADEAIRLMEQCLDQHPDHVDCVLQLASALASRGNTSGRDEDHERARDLYAHFVALAPNHPAAPRVREMMADSALPTRRSRGPELSEQQVTELALANALGRLHELEALDPSAAIVVADEMIRIAPHSMWTFVARQKLETLLATTARPKGPPASTTEADALYERACALDERDLAGARQTLEDVRAKAPTNIVGLKAGVRIEMIDQRARRNQERILEAKTLFLQASKLRDRAQARELLERVLSLDFGGPEGAKAMALLAKLLEAEAVDELRAAPPPSETVTLRLHERRKLTLEGLERLLIEDSEVAEVMPTGGDGFDVVGARAGTTRLVVSHDGKVSTWRVRITR